VLDGAMQRLRRERNERMSQAWHIEALARTKRLPKLNAMLDGGRDKPRRMTPEQLEAATREWLSRARRR
jgi:hypothetical protein